MEAKLFCSYARKDLPYLNKIKTHLRPLEREGLISEFWFDRNISAGADWEKEIDDHLNNAHIILLLVSPDFIASDYCYSKEVIRAIERHDQGQAIVIPVILRPASWQNMLFGKLQVLPPDAKPINDSSWNTQDNACVKVADGIREAIKELSKKQSVTESPQSEDNTKETVNMVEEQKQPTSTNEVPVTSPLAPITGTSQDQSSSSSESNLQTRSQDNKPDLGERLKNYKERLARMEADIDFGGHYTLTEHFAHTLDELLIEIIKTFRTSTSSESSSIIRS